MKPKHAVTCDSEYCKHHSTCLINNVDAKQNKTCKCHPEFVGLRCHYPTVAVKVADYQVVNADSEFSTTCMIETLLNRDEYEVEWIFKKIFLRWILENCSL